ncbi:MAG TPA: 3-hydroxyacyl-CoA dehydrogenase NAD-binding domain-containing protein, partial [Zeimonas sp.]
MNSPASNSVPFQCIGVVGSGAMGRGIAQLFAQAGFAVRLYDANPAAVASAIAALEDTFARLVDKGRLAPEAAQRARSSLTAVDSLDALAGCDLVVEAIVERLDAKRELFQALEPIVGDEAVLATNTSSLSVTAIAARCRRAERIAGLHFFNPVPLMKVVEVVRAMRTDETAVERLVALVRTTGHRPVVTRDTPGFIVNHAGRAYGTEALAALGEGVADVEAIDRILREQVSFDGNGFRLGPFELLDLTALDVSQPVMESIYRQFYDEPRFRPSVLGAQRLAAGLLGRKSGEGFYRYGSGGVRADSPGEPAAPSIDVRPPVWVAPGPRAALVASAARALGAVVRDGAAP